MITKFVRVFEKAFGFSYSVISGIAITFHLTSYFYKKDVWVNDLGLAFGIMSLVFHFEVVWREEQGGKHGS